MSLLNSKSIFLGVIIILLLIAGGFYVWIDLRTPAGLENENVNNATGTPQNIPEIVINPAPDIPVPALPWPVSVKNDLSGEARNIALKNIETLTSRLKNDPSLYDHWLDLALYRRSIGDFEGARDAWVYGAALRPNDFIPPHNLGDLYTYNLNDFNKAEEYYKASLKLEPDEIMVYQKLYELYRFKMKNDAKARAILEEGIAKNPGAALRLEVILDEWDQSL